MIDTKLKWWAYKDEWGRVEGTREATISSVELLNHERRKTAALLPKEDLIVKIEFTVKEQVKKPHFGVAIFREDGVYCYGPNTLFDGYKIDYLFRGNGWFSIIYKSLPLLAGNYRLSVAIWDEKEILAYNYHAGLYKFRILGRSLNNQLFEMEYKWDNLVKNLSLGYNHILPLKVLREVWKKVVNYQNSLDIKRVELLNINDKVEMIFKTNETLKVKIYLSNNKLSGCVLWVGVFREDGIYCHGVYKELETDKNEISLIYPKFLLLNGNYLTSVGVFKLREKKILVCHHGIYPFKIISDLKDHGTVYCEHRWKWKLP